MSTKFRLWMVVQGRDAGHHTHWEVVHAHPDDGTGAADLYRSLTGSKMLLLWTMLHGISVWKINHGQTVYGDEMENPHLPWEILKTNDRVNLLGKVHAMVVRFFREG